VTRKWRARVWSEVRGGERVWLYTILGAGQDTPPWAEGRTWAAAVDMALGVLASLPEPGIPPWPFPALIPAEACAPPGLPLPRGMKVAVQLRVRDHQLEVAPRGTPGDSAAGWIGCGPAAAVPADGSAPPAVLAAHRAYRSACQ